MRKPRDPSPRLLGLACLAPASQATDFTPAKLNLAKDSDSKVTAKSYCPDPVRILPTRVTNNLSVSLRTSAIRPPIGLPSKTDYSLD